MLLAVNIGNTNINFGVFKSGKLVKKHAVPVKGYSLSGIKKWLPVKGLCAAVICSVVPEATLKLSGKLKKELGIPVYIIGKDVKVPLKNFYRSPGQLGDDRLVNAYAGAKIYGVPLIVADLGTAITFDIVSKRKEYLGGMILPGIGMSLEALSGNTALLPKIKPDKPEEFIARDTRNGMLSGVFYGFGCMISALSAGIKKKIGRDAKVVLTGGSAAQIAPYCKGINKIDPDLTFNGIFLLTKELLELK